jgi:nucleoside-triphosphatase
MNPFPSSRLAFPADFPLMKLLLTGPPGIGKTTVIQTVLSGIKITAGGFYTHEIRRGRSRVGFSLKTLDGKEGLLAHIDYRKGHWVGRYGVDIGLFEALALPALDRALREKELIVIDEIGRMELFSQAFQQMVMRVLDQDERHLLGVIHQGRGPFSASVKRHRDMEVISVSHANRDVLPSQIITRLQGAGR